MYLSLFCDRNSMNLFNGENYFNEFTPYIYYGVVNQWRVLNNGELAQYFGCMNRVNDMIRC